MKKKLFIIPAFFCCLSGWCNKPIHLIRISKNEATFSDVHFQMGTATNPLGNSIHVNSQGLLFDGAPVLPVMGEFHYSRFPDTEWRKELLKMKAGGINIVASYIFWIHHEEREGSYNWNGQRNLRKFIETCQEVGLPVVLRIGPWCHGEARNGGFPEWLVTSGIKLRSNNQAYLEKVQTWFEHLYKQVEGLIWKDGGPVIGVQIENEYRGDGAHLMTLKRMIQQIGYDVPLYTRTGWPKLSNPVPFGEIIPLYGDYADGFWDRTIEEMPGDYGKSYLFRSFRNSTVIATEQLPKQSEKDNPNDIGYPYFTCELGGGMMSSYHRRIDIAPMDVYSMALVRVGSGSNLPGYYMYHGGTNPDSKVTTLNERQDSYFTNYNDLPVKTYDFQAPLGEFGQINPHYHLLRKLHLFLHDFGNELSGMQPYFPESISTDFNKDSLLRWCVRSNGESGYVFVNNYHRLKELSPQKNIQFTIDLPDQNITFPDKQMNIASGASFFVPFNMNIGDTQITYSTTQPLTKRIGDTEDVYVFTSISGISPEFMIRAGQVELESSNVPPITKGDQLLFKNMRTGTGPAISFRNKNNKLTTIVLLDEATALSCWKGKLADKEHIFLTTSGLTYHKNNLELTDKAGTTFSTSIYPKLQSLMLEGELLKGETDGIFTNYQVKAPKSANLKVTIKKIKEANMTAREAQIGCAGVAQQPSENDFNGATVWKINLPNNINPQRNIKLRISYIGDVARIYLGDKLLTDNFYNGKPFELELTHFSPDICNQDLIIKILPLHAHAPIYLPVADLDFSNQDCLIKLEEVDIIEECTVTIEAM